MSANQTRRHEFVQFLLSCGALAFGDFETKSGRQTPYFVNIGRISGGKEIRRLAAFYARAIHERLADRFDVLFGPAYKGIPLVVATAIALGEEARREVSFCFNRKEAKDHGEGGNLVGHELRAGERVLIIEDVTTAGTSIRETVPLLLRAAPIQLAGLVVAVDRQERGSGSRSALAELEEEFRMPCFAIVTLDEIVEELSRGDSEGRASLAPDVLERVRSYRARYGAG